MSIRLLGGSLSRSQPSLGASAETWLLYSLDKKATKKAGSTKITTVWECAKCPETIWNHFNIRSKWKTCLYWTVCTQTGACWQELIRKHFSTLSTNLNDFTTKTRFILSNLNHIIYAAYTDYPTYQRDISKHNSTVSNVRSSCNKLHSKLPEIPA